MKERPKFNVKKFIEYLFSCIITFLAPILLSACFTAISVLTNQENTFIDEFKLRVFDQIMHAVLSLLILVVAVHMIRGAKTRIRLSVGWERFYCIAIGVCFVFAFCFFGISCLLAANTLTPFFILHYKTIVAIEFLSASAGIIAQCLTNTEAFVVI